MEAPNPIKMWDGLSKNGKIAVVAGVVAISLLWYYRSRQKAATAAAASTASTDTTNNSTSTDPTSSTDSSMYDTSGYGSSYGDYGGYDSSLDPTAAYQAGYDSAVTAYGSNLPPSTTSAPPTTGTDTTSGAGATNSNGTPTASPVTINNDYPSSTTGGGAPSTPPAALAHTTAPATSTGSPIFGGAILAPAGSRTTKAGYVTVGTGNGNYQYVPDSAAPKGYTLWHSISGTKPTSNAKGLGNGLWAVPVGTSQS